MEAIIAAGYPYELLGIFYYVLFLMMGRKQYVGKYTNRSRYLAVLAAMSMVGCVPFHYATTFVGMVIMFFLAALSLVSMAADTLANRTKGRLS